MNQQDNREKLTAWRGLSYSDIKAAWQELIKENGNTPRMARLMSRSQLDILEEGTVPILRFYVVIEPQRQWIAENKLSGFEKRLREILGVDKVRLEVSCDPVKAEANKDEDSL